MAARKKAQLTERERLEKAEAAAAKKRERNQDVRQALRDDPTNRERFRKLLVADLRRVYEHPDNPFKGYAASRKRYRQLGHYSEAVVEALFGNHTEFCRAAGLHDSRTTTRARNTTAKLHTEQEIGRYAERHVLRYVGEHPKRRGKGRYRVAVIFSDLHAWWCDRFLRDVMLDVIDLVDPDDVIGNGDIADFFSVTNHTKMPGALELDLQGEIDFVRDEVWGPIRKRAPKANVSWLIGNHEFRLVRYFADRAPAAATLRCLEWGKAFELDELGINLAFGGNFMMRSKGDQNRQLRDTKLVLHDSYVVTHGHRVRGSEGLNAARRMITRFGRSGTSGHAHTPATAFVPTDACPLANWSVSGMMCDPAVGQEWADSPTQWTPSFLVVTIDTKTGACHPQHVANLAGTASFAGHLWQRTGAGDQAKALLVA